eukprot:gene10735-7464_t
MGGCVSAIMESRSEGSLIPHQFIPPYRTYGVQSGAVPGTESSAASPVYRFRTLSDEEQRELEKDMYWETNWPKVLMSKAESIPDQPAVAYRIIERVENRPSIINGKERIGQFYHCSERRTLSYKQLWEKMTTFGRGLHSLGLAPRSNVCIYEETRWEWLVALYGIWTQNLLASTVYANLGEDALRYALLESSAAAIITSGKQLPMLIKLLVSTDLHPLIIYLDAAPQDLDTKGYRLHSWDSIMEMGERNQVPLQLPENNETEALIMYTSGTTGDPKGVIHTHGSLAAGFKGLNHRLTDLYPKTTKKNFYVACLPLAHILELSLVNLTLYNEMMVGFGSPRTLTDTFAVPHGDLHEFAPNFIIGVPRIFDTIKKSVEAKLPAPNTFKRTIFDKAYESRLNALDQGKETPYWNNKVFATARAVLGPNMIGMLSGGGPLSVATHQFINVVCGGPMLIQGWGLTETVCCGTTQRLGDLEPLTAGQLIRGAEVKLVDTEDYKHTDTPEPRGELCIRGPFLFKGYYKQPELTKEAIDEDGWFHTGDVGSMSADGRVRIVGRIKALAKNCLGEYIALETLEAVYSQNDLCAVNGVCVFVHPDRPYIVALVLTEPSRALRFAQANGINSPNTYPEVLENPKFHTAAAASLAKTAKQASRQNFEVVKFVRVLSDEWTPENGLVTPTSKLRRSKVQEHYRAVVDELFKSE